MFAQALADAEWEQPMMLDPVDAQGQLQAEALQLRDHLVSLGLAPEVAQQEAVRMYQQSWLAQQGFQLR